MNSQKIKNNLTIIFFLFNIEELTIISKNIYLIFTFNKFFNRQNSLIIFLRIHELNTHQSTSIIYSIIYNFTKYIELFISMKYNQIERVEIIIYCLMRIENEFKYLLFKKLILSRIIIIKIIKFVVINDFKSI